MINPAVSIWLLFRASRWFAWIVFFGWAFYYSMDKQPHLNSFNQLKLYASMMFFIPGVLAMFAGCFELMMREKAGLRRPNVGQLIPPRQTDPLQSLPAR